MAASTPPEEPGDGWREIRHYAYVERPFDDVWALLVRSPDLVLGAGGEDGGGPAEALLHIRRAGRDVAREVTVRFGGLVCDEDRARLSLRWEDAHHPRLFPVLAAVLEVAALKSGRHHAQVGVVGRYRPPFGAIGAVADRLAGEAVVAESLGQFVRELARRLETLIPERDISPEDRPGGAVSVGRLVEGGSRPAPGSDV